MARPRLDSSSTPARFATIRIVAHAPQTARRLAWRFAETHMETGSCDYTQALADASVLNDRCLLIVDLGWSGPELDQSLDFLFRVTYMAQPPKVVALVPRMTGQSRPQWAELGVALAVDRITPPPEIAECVMKMLQIPTLMSN